MDKIVIIKGDIPQNIIDCFNGVELTEEDLGLILKGQIVDTTKCYTTLPPQYDYNKGVDKIRKVLKNV